jgi:hypothetical protein
MLCIPPVAAADRERQESKILAEYGTVLQKYGRTLIQAPSKPKQQATGTVLLKGYPQSDRFVVGGKCRALAKPTGEKVAYQNQAIPVYTMNVILAPTAYKTETSVVVPCSLSDCALVRGTLVARVSEGLIVQQAEPPAGGWPGTSSLNRASSTDARRPSYSVTEIEAYGSTKQSAGHVLVDAIEEPWKHPVGNLFLKGYPDEETITEGARLKVIALPTNGFFNYQGQRLQVFTLNYVINKDQDWRLDPNRGSLAAPAHRGLQ